MNKKEQTLEELLDQVDQVVQTLEQGDASLDESFDAYKKGMDLLKKCNEKIDKVEKQMMVLDEQGDVHEFS